MVGDLELNTQLLFALDTIDLLSAAQQYLSPDAYGIVVLKPAEQ